MAVDIPLRKINTEQQQGLYVLGLKIPTKVSQSTKNVKAKECLNPIFHGVF